MIFVAGAAFSQNFDIKNQKDINNLYNNAAYQKNTKHIGFTVTSKLNTQKPAYANAPVDKPFSFLNTVSCPVITADHYTQNFGFFCKKELQFEKATKIPLRFRLGTLQYNDYLERKPNAVNPF